MSKKYQPSTGTLVIAKDRLFSQLQEVYFEKGETLRVEDAAVLEKLIELGLVELAKNQADEPISEENN